MNYRDYTKGGYSRYMVHCLPNLFDRSDAVIGPICLGFHIDKLDVLEPLNSLAAR